MSTMHIASPMMRHTRACVDQTLRDGIDSACDKDDDEDLETKSTVCALALSDNAKNA